MPRDRLRGLTLAVVVSAVVWLLLLVATVLCSF